MPQCAGRPFEPCPYARNDNSVAWSICDLFLCPDCYEFREPILKIQDTFPLILFPLSLSVVLTLLKLLLQEIKSLIMYRAHAVEEIRLKEADLFIDRWVCLMR